MKRLLTVFAVLSVALSASAQGSVAFRFGCIHYAEVLAAMPEMAVVDEDMRALRAKYEEEMMSSQEEFNTKYETFLNEYENYAPSILRKRQAELEDMMRRNEQFRLESLRLLEQAHEEMMQPVRAKLDAIIDDVATEYSLAFVLNLDSDAVPFVNKSMAHNITKAVKDLVAKDN